MKEINENDDNNNNDKIIQENNNDKEESIKVVLVGESGVGKTSLISLFTSGKVDPDITTTNGATFITKREENIENNKKIFFEIWDTAGQEKYRSLSKRFFHDANVALIVYDITNKKSFDEIKGYWMDFLKENSPENIIKYIVGNKCDLSINQQITEEEAQDYAEKNNAYHWLTSDKEQQRINRLFDDIKKKFLSIENSNNEENGKSKGISIDNQRDNIKERKCIC